MEAKRLGSDLIFNSAILLFGIFLTGCSDSTTNGSLNFIEGKADCESQAIPKQYAVKWKSGSVTLESAESNENFKEEFLRLNSDKVELAEPNYRVTLEKPVSVDRNPAGGEPVFDEVNDDVKAAATLGNSELWGQDKIRAQEAWDRGFQGQGVVVAVVDSGVDLTHPQLKNQLLLNTKEIPGNGIDDDGNGVVDDVYGYDFDRNTGDVRDGSDHGTHVSGIILAEHANGNARGIAPKAKLVPVDFLDDGGQGDLVMAVMGIDYAVKRGARVINASWGGSCSAILEKKIGELESKNVLFVAASGNNGFNLDVKPSYPAAYSLPSMIVVGASTSLDYQITWSNYSYNYVHLVAPGDNVFSTIPLFNNKGDRTSGYAYMSGTSMATPFVTGAAAVLLSARPNATNAQLRDALFASVHTGGYQVQTRGRLDLAAALDYILSHVASGSSVVP